MLFFSSIQKKANKSLNFLCLHFFVKSWDSLGLPRAEYGPHFGDMVQAAIMSCVTVRHCYKPDQ